MPLDLATGLKRIGEAQSAAISFEVTERAKAALEKERAELDQAEGI